MAADADNLADSINNLNLSDPDSDCQSVGDQYDEFEKKWGFRLSELFKLCVSFYKEQDGKAIHLSYEDKLQLVAYHKQAIHGKYKQDTSPAVGFLDFIGSNRRQAWQSLGDMPKSEAKSKFISLVETNSSLFRPYIDAKKSDKEEQLKKQMEAEEAAKKENEERSRLQAEESLKQHQELERRRQLETERQIREALNQQTVSQFKMFAEQQCPDDVDKQGELITQLQEQHFQQYMQQVYQQQLLHQQKQQQSMSQQNSSSAMTQQNAGEQTTSNHLNGAGGESGDDELRHDLVEGEENTIAAARMWTTKTVKDFKGVLKSEPESVIKVGSGETVTIRVPTHEDGNCLFWEFATDSYDIGFGVYFEWTIAATNEVSVHVSESSEDDEGEELEERRDEARGDPESGGGKRRRGPDVPTDEIIPVYRRDCHEEVYCGSHTYPGQGVYLLKFDNSYSLWRSKTLYYRVYFTK